MRRTRFMSQLFLVLSLAFFFVEDFRWGVWGPIALTMSRQGGRLERWTSLSSAEVREWAQEAEAKGDAGTLAFAAYRLRDKADREDAVRFAEQAVARDPRLTWVYLHAAWANGVETWTTPPFSGRLMGWIAALEAHAKDNAVPALMRAKLARHRAEKSLAWKKGLANEAGSAYFDNLAQQAEWRAAMREAFERPLYSAWLRERFDLDREVLRRHGRATPLLMAQAVTEYPAPGLLNVLDYASLEVQHLGPQAESKKRLEDALTSYRRVVGFGQRMGLEAKTVAEELIALDVRKSGAEAMGQALRRAGRVQEATLWEQEVRDVRGRAAQWGRLDPFVRTSMRFWSAFLVRLFATLVVLFLFLTLAAVAYVNLKPRFRPGTRGRLYEVVTISENYLPVFLFVSCLGLYLVHTPYAHNFRHYMSVEESVQSLEPFFENVLPYGERLPASLWLPIERPFASYLPVALAGLALVVLFAAWRERRRPGA